MLKNCKLSAVATPNREKPKDKEEEVGIVSFSKNCSRKSNIYKSLYPLKLIDTYKLGLTKFMFALHSNRLPKFFYGLLTKLESVHDYNIRQLTKHIYFKPPVNKNIGKETIICRRGSLREEIDMNTKNTDLASFKMKYKKL